MTQIKYTLLKKNKPPLPTQVLYLFQIYMPFVLPGLQASASQQIRERKL